MSLLAASAPIAPALPAVPVVHAHPCLKAVARRAGLNLAIGCLVPAAVFYTLFHAAGVWTAIVATLAWSYGTLGWRALTGRRTPGLLVLTTAVLTVRTVVALLADSAFLYFLQPILTDVLIATAFLVSLRLGRPLIGRLAGDFYPLSDEVAARPAICALIRRLTLLWAALWLTKASLGLWLLMTQPLEVYVPVKAVVVLVVNATAMATTIAAAAYVGRREGLMGSRR